MPLLLFERGATTKKSQINALLWPCDMKPVQPDGRSEDMYVVWLVAAVLAEDWWGHPDGQQVMTAQRATWMCVIQSCV